MGQPVRDAARSNYLIRYVSNPPACTRTEAHRRPAPKTLRVSLTADNRHDSETLVKLLHVRTTSLRQTRDNDNGH